MVSVDAPYERERTVKAKLVVVKGAKPMALPLRLPTIIGRSSQAALKLRTTVVSRKHCEVFESGGEVYIKDLGSANGTFVNNVRIEQPTKLETGDQLRVGPVTLRAEFDQVVVKKKKMPVEPDGSIIDLSEGLPPNDPDSLSMVNYEETRQGSFLGIEDGDAGGDGDGNRDPSAAADQGVIEEAEAVVEAKVVEEAKLVADADPVVDAVPVDAKPPTTKRATPVKSKEAEEAEQVLGGLENEGESIEADDSALNDFFNNLG